MKMSHIFNTSGLMPVFKSNHMNHNQGRSFGPLLGLFLVNLLAKAVSAKYLSYFPYHYDPGSWLAYNKPELSYNHHSYYSQWYPIKNPYESPAYQGYPILTTVSPYVDGEHPEYDDYHGNYDYPYYPHYDKLVPAASNNVQKEYTKRTTTVGTSTTPNPTTKETTTSPTETTTIMVTTTVPPTYEPIPAESRRQPQKNRRRGPNRGNRYPQRRRRPTPTPEYYDSYEDYYQPNKRRKPQSSEAYEDEYYDSFETTTRYFKKQKRRPTRKNNRNQNQNDDSFEIETNTEKFNPNTEIVIVRQAQTTTTTTTTTTTEPPTIITNSTVSSTTPNSNNTYGYGPSNGNEQVSFTYGPPVGKYQYQVPYVDWYTQEETKNAIVKRVRDIVNVDKRRNLK